MWYTVLSIKATRNIRLFNLRWVLRQRQVSLDDKIRNTQRILTHRQAY